MWFFLSSRLRRFIFTTIAIPLLGKAAHKVSAEMERKSGPTRVSKGLRQAGDLTTRRSRTTQRV